MSTNAKAWLGIAALAAIVGGLVFVAAGTLDYWRGWVFLVVYFGFAAAMTADLMRRDPALLERRLRGGPFAETAPAQRLIMSAISVGFVALLVVPAIAWREGWAPTSAAASIAGDGLMAAGFAAIGFVTRANTFAAATVGVVAGQRVVSTGPYALVRHPMYAGGLVLLVGAPLALGSWWGLAPLALMLPFLIWRLLDEERLLAANLPGYRDYMAKVRWRLAPGVF